MVSFGIMGWWTTSRVRVLVLIDHTLEMLQQASGSVQRWHELYARRALTNPPRTLAVGQDKGARCVSLRVYLFKTASLAKAPRSAPGQSCSGTVPLGHLAWS